MKNLINPFLKAKVQATLKAGTDKHNIFLEEILSNKYPKIYEQLIKYSAKSYALENIFFLELCHQFKKNPIKKIFDLIHYDYIHPSTATFSVNISSKTLEDLKAKYNFIHLAPSRGRSKAIVTMGEVNAVRHTLPPELQYVPANILDDARSEIFKLTERDYFTRFTKELEMNNLNINIDLTDNEKKLIKEQRANVVSSEIMLSSPFLMDLN